MKKLTAAATLLLVAVLLIAASRHLQAQQENLSATVPVRTVVTVLGKNFSEPPAVSRDDIQVYEGKDKLTVSEWTPAQGCLLYTSRCV